MSNQLLWYTTRGAGAVTLLLLSTVVVLGILGARRFEAPGWPRFLTTALHENVALLALAMLTVHVVTAVVDPFTHLGLTPVVIPFGSYYRTFWLGLGTVAAELFAALIVTSLLRGRLGPRLWKTVHWLAYACWPIALLHGFGTGTDAFSMWLLTVQGICMVGVAVALGVRLLALPADPLAADRERFRRRVTRELPR